MTFRTTRERIVQSCAYEAGGIVIATPIYAAIFDAGVPQSTILMVALSVALLIWLPFHEWVFDAVEWRLTGRLASDRPHLARVGHALSLEASSIVVCVPVIMSLGGHGFWEAVAIDLGLTVLCVGYAYLFFLGWDRLRPIPVPKPDLPVKQACRP